MKVTRFSCILFAVLAAAVSLRAISIQVPYSGQLAESGDLVTGTKAMQFVIVDGGGAARYTGSTMTVPVTNGAFRVVLGDSNQPPLDSSVFDGSLRRLRITVNGVTLSPDQDIHFTPQAAFAVAAGSAGTASNALSAAKVAANSITTSNLVDGSITPDKLFTTGVLPGQIFKYDGSEWGLAGDNNTTYSAGPGLSLNLTTFSVSFGGSGAATTVARSDHNHSAVYAPTTHTHSAAEIVSGMLDDARLSANVALHGANQLFSGSNVFSGANTFTNPANVFLGTFAGNGAALSNVTVSTANVSGILPDAQLSQNVARLNANQTFTGGVSFSPAAGAPFTAGNSTVVNNLNADLLDGLHAADLLGVNAKAVDADKLDGLDSTAFALSGHVHSAAEITSGIFSDARLPSNLARINASQMFSGTNVFSGVAIATNAANIWSGTLTGDVVGNIAGHATTAGTADNFSGLLAGDVTGTQNATVVSSVGGQSAASVAGGASAANAAASANVPNTMVKRDGGGSFAASAVSAASFSGDGAGVTNLNASVVTGGTLADARLSANVALLNAGQTFGGANAFTNPANLFTGAFTGDGAAVSNVVVSAANISGTISDSKLSANVARLNANQTFSGTVNFNSAANSIAGTFSGNGAGVANVNAARLNGLAASNFWQLGGNGGTSPGTSFLGTTDNQPFELRVNNTRALRIEPNVAAPNLIGGSPLNSTGPGVAGAIIAGGHFNRILNGSTYSAIGGGLQNTIDSLVASSVIAGGQYNSIQGSSANSTIGGGEGNTIQFLDLSATISGGEQNTIRFQNNYSTIGGGYLNSILDNANLSTIGGGFSNAIPSGATLATIPGGDQNVAGTSSFAAGHRAKAIYQGGFVWADSTEADFSSTGNNQFLIRASGGVGIGNANPATALDVNGTVTANAFSGSGNSALDISVNGARALRLEPTATNGSVNVIGGSIGNTAAASVVGATIAGGGATNYNGLAGANSVLADFGAIGGGASNTVSGQFGVVPGGQGNLAKGNHSFAAGRFASATNNNSFVWSDGSANTYSTISNQFLARAKSGFIFYTSPNTSAGAQLAAGGGSWSTLSDRNAKENFAPANAKEILARVVAMPIQTWNYKSQDAAVRHIGPMAQDFHAAFRVGEDETHITTVDADGVALAAIQGLNQKVDELNGELKRRAAENNELKLRLEQLEKLVQGHP